MKLYYVFDSICIFSYGFHPLIKRLLNDSDDKISYELIPGGLWTRNNIKEISEEVVSNLKKASKKINEMTNQNFGDGFFNFLKSYGRLNSYPSSKAITSFLSVYPNLTLDFIEKVFLKRFIEGKELEEIDDFIEIIKEMNLETEEFENHFNSNIGEDLVDEYFKKRKTLGVTSYPTLLIEKEGEILEYDLDYSNYEKLKAWIDDFSE